MTSDTGVWLEDLTWPEAKARFEARALVVVPVGAAAKAHGPHLPLKTDALTARALAQRLIECLPAVAAPVVGFGFYPAFTSFAGSQHLSAETFKALLAELLGNLRGHGVRRLVILNTGVSTEKPIDEVAGGAADLLVLHMRGLGAAADKLHADLTRTLLAHHHHGSSAVRDEADIVAPQRLHNERRLHVLVERERHAQRRVRVVGAVVAHRDRDLAELLRLGPVLGDVPLHGERIAGRD